MLRYDGIYFARVRPWREDHNYLKFHTEGVVTAMSGGDPPERMQELLWKLEDLEVDTRGRFEVEGNKVSFFLKYERDVPLNCYPPVAENYTGVIVDDRLLVEDDSEPEPLEYKFIPFSSLPRRPNLFDPWAE